jgi:hypothetical protein
MTTTSLKARCTSCRLLLLILRLTCVREHILVRTHSKFALGVAFHCSAAPSPPLFTSVSKMHDMRIVHTLRCTHNAHSLDPARPHKHGILINVCRIDVLSLSLSLSLSSAPLSSLSLFSLPPPPSSLTPSPPSLPPSLSFLSLITDSCTSRHGGLRVSARGAGLLHIAVTHLACFCPERSLYCACANCSSQAFVRQGGASAFFFSRQKPVRENGREKGARKARENGEGGTECPACRRSDRASACIEKAFPLEALNHTLVSTTGLLDFVPYHAYRVATYVCSTTSGLNTSNTPQSAPTHACQQLCIKCHLCSAL